MNVVMIGIIEVLSNSDYIIEDMPSKKENKYKAL